MRTRQAGGGVLADSPLYPLATGGAKAALAPSLPAGVSSSLVPQKRHFGQVVHVFRPRHGLGFFLDPPFVNKVAFYLGADRPDALQIRVVGCTVEDKANMDDS